MPKLPTNLLLAALSPSDLALIRPSLHAVELEDQQKIDASLEPIEFCHFLTNGVAAVSAPVERGNRLETGMIGWEGVTGLAAILGNLICPNETVMQIPGASLRIAVSDLRCAMEKSPSLAKTLTRYAHVFLVQATQTALANGCATLDMRLARWLLMATDRLTSPTLRVTHDILARMLGVRRAGVTTTIHILEGHGLIKSRRTVVTIRDRPRLVEYASWSYGVPEETYARVFGVNLRREPQWDNDPADAEPA